jgi:hypothetical protein
MRFANKNITIKDQKVIRIAPTHAYLPAQQINLIALEVRPCKNHVGAAQIPQPHQVHKTARAKVVGV